MTINSEQAGDELGQAKLKLGFGLTSVDEQEILLAKLTPTIICH